MKKLIRLLRYDWPLHFVLLFTNWLPDNVIFLRLRGWFASPFFGSCGKNLRLGRNITFYNPSKISFGNDIYIAYGCWLACGAEIIINDEVMIGPYCVVASGDHSSQDGSFRYGDNIDSPIKVGKGTWVSSHVILTGGTNIGEGCLISANSVITTIFVENNILIGGSPAKKIKRLIEK